MYPSTRLIRKVAILVTLSSIALVLGCNTIEGAGRDMKAAGGAIEKAAGKNKSY